MNLLLYTRETLNVSNEAYHELSMICKDLPRSWKVQERKERLEIRLQALLKTFLQILP